MDTELIKKYLDMFKIALIVLIVGVVAGIGLLVLTVPETIKYFNNKGILDKTQQELQQKENDLQTAKANKAKKEKKEKEQVEVKAFYKNIKNTGSSTSDILAGEIQEINDLIKYYGIKVYKVDYKYDPEEDIFFKEKKDKYSVCNMNMELFGSYMKFQSFMKDLYKHEHFLNIQGVEINPYKKDKSILHIKLDLSLYAEKDPNAGQSREVPPTNDSTGGGNGDLDLDLDLSF